MFRFQFIAVCFVYTVVCTVHVNCDFLANLPTNLDLLKSQIELAKHLLNKADRKDLEGTLLEKGYNDTKCLEQLNDLRIALNSSELWAMKGKSIANFFIIIRAMLNWIGIALVIIRRNTSYQNYIAKQMKIEVIIVDRRRSNLADFLLPIL